MVALDINPGRALVRARVQLGAGGANAKGVHVPGGSVALAKRNLLRLGDAAGADLAEGRTEVGAAEQARVGANPDLTGHRRVSGDVLDGGDGAAKGGGNLGEGGAGVCAAVESGARAGIEDGVVALVRGDGGAGGDRGHGGEGALVLRAENAPIAGRPDNGVGIGRVGEGAAVFGVVGAGVRVPGRAAVSGEGNLRGAVGVAGADNAIGLVAGVVYAR